MIRRALVLLAPALLLAGCGGSSSPNGVTVQAAKRYTLESFTPSAPVTPGKPVKVSFVIQQPNGLPLTEYRTGSGPHTGVHLIVVSRDLSQIIHTHPPIAADGTVSETATFTKPGPYRVVVDAYPKSSGPQQNFQLFAPLTVKGRYAPEPLPPFSPVVKVDGYTIRMLGKPDLHQIQPAYLHLTVTDPDGKPVAFVPWYGALAHAIFFRQGTLDYFHTHVCSPGMAACAAAVGGSTKIAGSSTTPGSIKVGVLVPEAGTWRLFLQFLANGTVITAPFTLDVKQ
jgi:hypothetical protein